VYTTIRSFEGKPIILKLALGSVILELDAEGDDRSRQLRLRRRVRPRDLLQRHPYGAGLSQHRRHLLAQLPGS
jgi:hypothetical protein